MTLNLQDSSHLCRPPKWEMLLPSPPWILPSESGSGPLWLLSSYSYGSFVLLYKGRNRFKQAERLLLCYVIMMSRTNLGRLIQIFADEEKLEGNGQVEILQLRVMLLCLNLTTLIVCLIATEPNKTVRWLVHRNCPYYFFNSNWFGKKCCIPIWYPCNKGCCIPIW